MKKLRLAGLLLVVGYLLTGIYQIRPEERAIVKRFGRIVAKPGPGLWISYPWGIDRVERVWIAKVRQIIVGYQPGMDDPNTMPGGQLLSGDQNLVNLQMTIDYAIAAGDKSVEDYLFQRDQVDLILIREAEALMAEWVAGHSVDEVLLSGNARLPRWMVERLQARVDPQRLGIRIQQASVATLSPPDEVRTAFESVNQAQTNIRTQEYRARQQAEQLMKSAEAEKFRLEQEGKTYLNTKRTEAQAEAEAFLKRLASYQRLKATNPDILSAIWWEEMGRVLVKLNNRGRIDLLDNHLGRDGLDITQVVSPAKRR